MKQNLLKQAWWILLVCCLAFALKFKWSAHRYQFPENFVPDPQAAIAAFDYCHAVHGQAEELESPLLTTWSAKQKYSRVYPLLIFSWMYLTGDSKLMDPEGVRTEMVPVLFGSARQITLLLGLGACLFAAFIVRLFTSQSLAPSLAFLLPAHTLLFHQMALQERPHVPGAFFAMGALYFALLARKTQKAWPLCAAALMAGLGLGTIPTVILVFVPLAFCGWHVLKCADALWKKAALISACLLVCFAGITVGWPDLVYGGTGEENKKMFEADDNLDLGAGGKKILEGHTFTVNFNGLKQVPQVFLGNGPLLTLCALAALFVSGSFWWKNHKALFFSCLLFFGVSGLSFVAVSFGHLRYWVLILPVLGVFCGLGLGQERFKRGLLALCALCVFGQMGFVIQFNKIIQRDTREGLHEYTKTLARQIERKLNKPVAHLILDRYFPQSLVGKGVFDLKYLPKVPKGLLEKGFQGKRPVPETLYVTNSFALRSPLTFQRDLVGTGTLKGIVMPAFAEGIFVPTQDLLQKYNKDYLRFPNEMAWPVLDIWRVKRAGPVVYFYVYTDLEEPRVIRGKKNLPWVR